MDCSFTQNGNGGEFKMLVVDYDVVQKLCEKAQSSKNNTENSAADNVDQGEDMLRSWKIIERCGYRVNGSFVLCR